MLAIQYEQRTSRLPAKSHPKKVVVLGDSLVYGFGDFEGGGWVERIRRRSMALGESGPVFYNLGVRGDGVRQVTQRLEQEFRLRGELRNRVPDLIILSVGVNDSARVGRTTGRQLTDYEAFQQDIESLLRQAKQLCPVLFVGMTPIDEQPMPFAEVLYYSHAEQWRYKEATRVACEALQVPYLDILSRWLKRGDDWWRPLISGDGLHPNVAGYCALLDDILHWEAFQSALDSPGLVL
ncbi:MAG: G-D-S-L family lipolytic protein [Cyanobacteria bacterium Co-bin13]|nr:G-D-S-L family lipolytic protein [Cyanobacteria bacterium Co-bin13]